MGIGVPLCARVSLGVPVSLYIPCVPLCLVSPVPLSPPLGVPLIPDFRKVLSNLNFWRLEMIQALDLPVSPCVPLCPPVSLCHLPGCSINPKFQESAE